MLEDYRFDAFTPILPEINGDLITNPDCWAASFPCPVEPPYDKIRADYRNPIVKLTPPPPPPQPQDHHVDFVDLAADQEWADSCLLDDIDVGNTFVEPPPVNSNSKVPCIDGDDVMSSLLDLIDFTTDQEGVDSCNLPPIANEGLDREFDDLLNKWLPGMTSPASSGVIIEAPALSTTAPHPSSESHPINTVPVSNDGRVRKRNPWTAEEHKLFLKGIDACGYSNWKSISEHYVKTRTPIQIASHAQKYNERRRKLDGSDPTRKRRKSIHDIVIDN